MNITIDKAVVEQALDYLEHLQQVVSAGTACAIRKFVAEKRSAIAQAEPSSVTMHVPEADAKHMKPPPHSVVWPAPQAEQPVVVPQGWKLVPVEATHEMCLAAHDGPNCGGEYVMQASDREYWEACYRAMLSASPRPAPAVPDAAKTEPKLCKCGISSDVSHICARYPKGNPAQMAVKPETQGERSRIVAAAKALCKRNSEACGIDFDDEWKFYSESFIADAKAALLAAGPAIPAPHECKTEEEKRAYAFGWWKALEHARAADPAHVEPLTVWEVRNKVFQMLFTSKEAAEKWLYAAGMNTASTYIPPVPVNVFAEHHIKENGIGKDQA